MNKDIHKIVKDTYEGIAQKYHKRYGQYSNFFLNYSNKFIKLLPKNAEVLDLGCGSGRDSKYFSENGLRVTGVDFSKSMLDIAKNNAPKVNFVLKDFRKIDELKGKFDGVWSSFSLLHLERKEIPTLLSKIKINLKSNGLLFIATKEGKGEIIEKENLDERLKMFETFFEKDELEDLLKENGYKILESYTDTDRYESNEKIIIIFAQK